MLHRHRPIVKDDVKKGVIGDRCGESIKATRHEWKKSNEDVERERQNDSQGMQIMKVPDTCVFEERDRHVAQLEGALDSVHTCGVLQGHVTVERGTIKTHAVDRRDGRQTEQMWTDMRKTCILPL